MSQPLHARSATSSHPPQMCWWVPPLLLLTVVAFGAGLNDYFRADLFDRILVASRLGTPGAGLGDNFRPVELLQLRALFGVDGMNPWVFNAAGLAGHFLNAVLVGSVVRSLLEFAPRLDFHGSRLVGPFAALAFALGPSKTEPVRLAVGGDVIATTYVLLAILAWARLAHRPLLRHAATASCWLVAMLAKESALAMLLVFPLIEFARAPVWRLREVPVAFRRGRSLSGSLCCTSASGFWRAR